MINSSPITPPQDKFDQWEDNILNEQENVDFVLDCVWKDGFQTGADQELEACCGFIGCEHSVAWSSKLRAARRPKPPSLKEQALALVNGNKPYLDDAAMDTIRRALEALPND